MLFRNKIFKIKIQSAITQKLFEKLQETLEGWTLFQPKMIAVILNTPGGSLVQSKNIAQLLQKYSKQKKAPLYCFGEDIVANSALAILTIGDKVFVNPYSMIGDIGYSQWHFDMQETQKKWHFKYQAITSGENAQFLNSFQPLNESHSEKLQDYLNCKQTELIDVIERNRAKHINSSNIQERQKNIYEQGFIKCEQFKQHGLIDGYEGLDQIIYQEFEGSKNKYIFGQNKSLY